MRRRRIQSSSVRISDGTQRTLIPRGRGANQESTGLEAVGRWVVKTHCRL
jgi:hypothetical protein